MSPIADFRNTEAHSFLAVVRVAQYGNWAFAVFVAMFIAMFVAVFIAMLLFAFMLVVHIVRVNNSALGYFKVFEFGIFKRH